MSDAWYVSPDILIESCSKNEDLSIEKLIEEIQMFALNETDFDHEDNSFEYVKKMKWSQFSVASKKLPILRGEYLPKSR